MFECEHCDKKVGILYSTKGLRVCETCYNDLNSAAPDFDLNAPGDLVWVGRKAKMGPQEHFNIPKTIRPFIKDGRDYIIIVKQIVGEE